MQIPSYGLLLLPLEYISPKYISPNSNPIYVNTSAAKVISLSYVLVPLHAMLCAFLKTLYQNISLVEHPFMHYLWQRYNGLKLFSANPTKRVLVYSLP